MADTCAKRCATLGIKPQSFREEWIGTGRTGRSISTGRRELGYVRVGLEEGLERTAEVLPQEGLL
jgi:hypothetical protein